MSLSDKSKDALPFRITVSKVISSRYDSPEIIQQIESDAWFSPALKRPLSWDLRRSGVDVVVDDEGNQLKLYSEGGQSVPAEGWILLLIGKNADNEYIWTLYGMAKAA